VRSGCKACHEGGPNQALLVRERLAQGAREGSGHTQIVDMNVHVLAAVHNQHRLTIVPVRPSLGHGELLSILQTRVLRRVNLLQSAPVSCTSCEFLTVQGKRPCPPVPCRGGVDAAGAGGGLLCR
jgi:hypothetical protein